MSFDPKVWTSDVPAARHVWVRWHGEDHAAIVRLFPEYPGEADISYPGTLASWPVVAKHGALRSILPLPSAEEHAALVDVAEKARTMSTRMDDWEENALQALRCEFELKAALSRLDAVRKEQKP